MSKLACIRILGYSATLVMFITNIFYMGWFRKRNPFNDQQVEVFKSLRYRFFTTWTILLHTAYAIFGLICELIILMNSKKKDFKLPSAISDFREIVFAGLVWPCSLVVFSVFWGLYAYDRELIFPEFLDKVIPSISNHVIHTMVIPVALWELVFRPRTEPETHTRNVMLLTLHLCIYLSVLFFTYMERGIWLYPIFKELFGTIYFVPTLAVMAIMFYIFYYIQWPLTKMIHSFKKKAEKKKAKMENKRK